MLYWVAINVPFNVLFSTIFCYIAYAQYKLYGSDIWRRLARQGIQTMCLALLCNTVCAAIVVACNDKTDPDMLIAVDW
jgi:hypothetical protein